MKQAANKNDPNHANTVIKRGEEAALKEARMKHFIPQIALNASYMGWKRLAKGA